MKQVLEAPALSRRTLLGAGLSLGALAACPALAELRIEITGVGANQLPIAIRPFQGTSQAPVDLARIIGDDLTRSGAFRLIDVGGENTQENLTAPEGLADAAQKGASIYIVGSVTQLSAKRWDVRCIIYDTVTGQAVDSVGYTPSQDHIRMAAHRCADRVYTRLTGEGPMFASQLAYVAQLGPHSYELIVSDSDGETPQKALVSNEPIISPVWSPDGRKLA